MPDDIYCYPNSNVLINKLDIREQEKLRIFERKLTMLRILEIMEFFTDFKLFDGLFDDLPSVNEASDTTESLFESIKHINKLGEECWYARELQNALEYTEWRNFSNVIERAKIACENSDNDVSTHFVEVNKIVNAGISSKFVEDYELSRYACYLIVQNGDSRKKVIALGQTTG